MESTEALRSVEVLDAAGRSIAHHNGAFRTIPAPDLPGTYLVRSVFADGPPHVTRLVRY
ncbi:MAG: hypothetical protein IPG92_13670 [Flavobacteriales bacterium]|nr:hypothetical protein [Flavobacteriales bacterium]